jgi:hypothetical protein
VADRYDRATTADLSAWPEGSWVSGRAWLDDDGKHVWTAHIHHGEVQTVMMPWPQWRANGHIITPSVHCTDCGFHAFPFITEPPALNAPSPPEAP